VSASALVRHPAVFLDRDGTLMVDVGYCNDPADVHLLPGAREALARLKQAGFVCLIVTNQSGIARGLCTEEQYAAVHEEMLRQLGPGLIDGAYYCAAGPWEDSPRRKPAPGMVFEAEAEHRLDLARSFFVGDKASDVECGRNAGTRAVLVLSGYGEGDRGSCQPDHVAIDITAAADWILQQT
jgi:D-glycero-D-manno-heptose 1,7-bisphosphate phosphatase